MTWFSFIGSLCVSIINGSINLKNSFKIYFNLLSKKKAGRDTSRAFYHWNESFLNSFSENFTCFSLLLLE